MPTDRPTDTPESLRALADRLAEASAEARIRGWTGPMAPLFSTENALRRAADRLDRVAALALPLDLPEATRDALAAWLQDSALVRVNILTGRIAKPGDLVWLHDTNGPVADAIAAARRAGAEEMRAAACTLVDAWARSDDQHVAKYRRGSGLWRDHWVKAARMRETASAILALPLPGDQP